MVSLLLGLQIVCPEKWSSCSNLGKNHGLFFKLVSPLWKPSKVTMFYVILVYHLPHCIHARLKHDWNGLWSSSGLVVRAITEEFIFLSFFMPVNWNSERIYNIYYSSFLPIFFFFSFLYQITLFSDIYCDLEQAAWTYPKFKIFKLFYRYKWIPSRIS